jgi:hypothetical protein
VQWVRLYEKQHIGSPLAVRLRWEVWRTPATVTRCPIRSAASRVEIAPDAATRLAAKFERVSRQADAEQFLLGGHFLLDCPIFPTWLIQKNRLICPACHEVPVLFRGPD